MKVSMDDLSLDVVNIIMKAKNDSLAVVENFEMLKYDIKMDKLGMNKEYIDKV